jgi:Ser/Thr protein kinase RdoA (MazF antagonist)
MNSNSSPEITRIKRLLEREYHLSIRSIEPLSEGNTTKKYRTAADGDTFVLRMRSAGFSSAALAADHRFMIYLHDREIPAPCIIRTANQDTFVVEDGALYELQRAIPHDANLDNFEFPAVSNQLFDALGKFHRVSSNYPETIQKPTYLGDSLVPINPAEKYFHGPRQHGVPRYLAAADHLTQGERAQFEHDIRFFETCLDRIYAAFQKKQRVLPTLVNHNDFYGNNILFHKGKITGIVDFDFCQTSLHLIDLIEALHGSLVWHNGAARYLGLTENGDIRVNLAQENLQRYFDHNPDFPYDGEFVIELLTAKIISLPWYPAIDFFHTTDQKLEGFRRMKAVIRKLEEVHAIPL